MRHHLLTLVLLLSLLPTWAHQPLLARQQSSHPLPKDYDVRWDSLSLNSSESMPCGGGEIGLNVWAEAGGDVLMYMSRSSAFDENNALLKLGRIRLRLEPNPFIEEFHQQLHLEDGTLTIEGADGTRLTFWVDVHHPVIHVDVKSRRPQTLDVSYENWRTQDYGAHGEAAHFCGMKGCQEDIFIHPDAVRYEGDQVLFYHRNRDDFIFSQTVAFEELEEIREQLWNPVKDRTFGGLIEGTGLVPSGESDGRYVDTDYHAWHLRSRQPRREHHLTVTTHIDQCDTFGQWHDSLTALQRQQLRDIERDRRTSARWWHDFWQRSYICIDSPTDTLAYEVGRNYQLFRYMLGCNAYGDSPTKFNGSLFTFDPRFVKGGYEYTPDFRLWGGALATAQNQRLVYWPMLVSGDWDMMDAEFRFYLRCQHNAELMTRSYWGHEGACFTEQIENFGLPVAYSYGMEPRTGYRPRGKQKNAYCEYLWDTVMDFCLMMMQTQTYEGRDVSPYIPFIESCLTFFDEHYRMLALQRTVQPFDRQQHYIFYPGTAGETYKMAYNSSQTIAALTTVLRTLLALPEGCLTDAQRTRWEEMLSHMPPLPFREMEGHRVIAPAQSWERLMNVEINQLYPVWPYGIYGIGRPDLEVARDTWRYGIDQPRWQKNRHESWHQDAIFCARLGLLDEARDLTVRKLRNGRHRFPAFFGPGHDWTPDHNWGGTGMSALQEMLMQTVGDTIYLMPCWPRDWNVRFRLHAPRQTTVEGEIRDGEVVSLKVSPEERMHDIIINPLGNK